MWPIPAALLLTLVACTTTPTQCIIHPLAILPTLGQLPFVPVLVQNQPATLMVDTGAIRSVLNMSIVQAAHMTTDQPGETIVGIGGSSDTIATVPSLTIGYATAHDVSFFASRFASRGPDGKPIDGLFGGDFLVNYDLLIDLPAHRVGLYETEGCAAATFAPFGPGVPNMAIWAVLLVLSIALLWLVQNTRIDLSSSKTQLNLRIALDIGYLAGAAIMLRAWWCERRPQPPPSSHRTKQLP